jgi:hypothetical protein
LGLFGTFILKIVIAYHTRAPGLGKAMMGKVVDPLTDKVPTGLLELARLAGILAKRCIDISSTIGTSNGPW